MIYKKYTVLEITKPGTKCLGSKNICGIYKITNLINNKIYIGSSKKILSRWRNHISELKNNKHSNMFLQEEWNEYGAEAFVFEVVEECEESKRYDVENAYLQKLTPFYRNDTGYNIAETSYYRKETSARLFVPRDELGLPMNEDYYIVKTGGCKPRIMNKDHCDTTTREELVEECMNLDTTDIIMHSYAIGAGGYDDWEW